MTARKSSNISIPKTSGQSFAEVGTFFDISKFWGKKNLKSLNKNLNKYFLEGFQFFSYISHFFKCEFPVFEVIFS